MIKKLTPIGLGLALALSMSACSPNETQAKDSEPASNSADSHAGHSANTTDNSADAAVVGINEIPVGDSGPQTDGPLQIDLVYFQAVDMEHGSMTMPPASESDMHFEVDVATTDDAQEWGYEADQFLPYLDINVTLTNKKTNEEIDLGTMMPMIASDGPHYGNNIKLEPGEYDVLVTVPSPGDKFMLHTGKDSSGVKGRFWTEPLKFEFKNWQWDGQLL